MIASLWDLKLTISGFQRLLHGYHDSFPMGFETICHHSSCAVVPSIMIASLWDLKLTSALDNLNLMGTIMIASLWDLKPSAFQAGYEAILYHDSFPMGFETKK